MASSKIAGRLGCLLSLKPNLTLGFLALLICRVDETTAADVLLYSVVKSQGWTQTGPAQIARSAGDKFVFQAGLIEASAGTVGSASVQIPVSTVERNLTRGNSSAYDLSYASSSSPTGGAEITTLAGFDAAYPNGTYVLRISSVNDGTRSVSVPLTGDTYPPVPQVANFSAAQQVDAASSFTVSWFPFVGGANSDFIHMRIVEDSTTIFQTGLPGTPTALNGSSTSVLIPAATLQPGKSYRLILFFAKATLIDRSTYPGATGYISYAHTLYSTLQTTAPAPAAPVANAATAVTTTSFMANWQSVAEATGYRIDVSTSSLFTDYVSGFWDLNAGTVTAKSIDGLSSGTTYYYRVRAYNSIGTSASSGVVTVTTAAAPPAAPTALPATEVKASGFTANWNAVAGVVGYRLDVFTISNDRVAAYQDLDVGNVTSANVTGLHTFSVPYFYFRVRAYNAAGSSANSSLIYATITPPSSPVATAATDVSKTAFTANWTPVDGAAYYTLVVSTNSALDSAIKGYDGFQAWDATSVRVTNLVGGTRFYYRVQARNSAGGSADSNVAEVFVEPRPAHLGIQMQGTTTVVLWTDAIYSLEASDEVNGEFNIVPAAKSPFTNKFTVSRQFFRLRGN